MTKFKLSTTLYEALLQVQDNNCAACKQKLGNETLDYSRTGAVRGILCDRCSAILKISNLASLTQLVDYLKRS